ncbi:MAG TPA: hypothetical protein VM910_29255 [Bradyrhizobium sp.]|nr:hypothetical protein [Bradyrhizobium sp.]
MARAKSSASESIITVPVRPRALFQRVNRALLADGKELRRTRGEPAIRALGALYVASGNGVIDHHVNLEMLARKLGVIEPYEHLIKD